MPGEQTGLAGPRALGGTHRGAGVGVQDDSGASRSFQCGKGVWLPVFSERKEMGLSLCEEGHPGGVSQRGRGPGEVSSRFVVLECV